jgi:hypothetical protein
MHTIKGVARHYGAEGACLRIRELEAALTDLCVAFETGIFMKRRIVELRLLLAKGVSHAGS